MNILRLDHLVLTVADIDATCAFYTVVLGMETMTFGEGCKALRFGNQKINLHQHGAEAEPKATFPLPGSADLCFITDTPLESVKQSLEHHNIHILSYGVIRTGATGPIRSVYFRDPDGNLLEVSNYL